MFRSKESSNRIELSQLVQDLLNFGDLGSLWLQGWGHVWMGWEWWWVSHTHVHIHSYTHMHTYTCMHGKRDNFMQMAAPLGKSLGISYYVICMCACMHAHVCVHECGVPSHHPHPHPHTPTPQGDPIISKNPITLELIKIIWFCLSLWRLPHPWVGVWFGGWVGGWVGCWVGLGQITKNFKNVDLIKIIQFSFNFLKIYDL